MTRDQAIRKLRAMFGAKAYFRVGNEITSPEKREAGRADRDRLRAEAAAIDAEVTQRLIDTGIQARMDEARALRKEADQRGWSSLGYRFSVGQLTFMGFLIEGQGDTWEEAIAAAAKKTAVDVQPGEAVR